MESKPPSFCPSLQKTRRSLCEYPLFTLVTGMVDQLAEQWVDLSAEQWVDLSAERLVAPVSQLVAHSS